MAATIFVHFCLQDKKGIGLTVTSEDNLDVENEYDPLWPNDYEKMVKERKEQREREREEDLRKRDLEEREKY